ncbi:Ger(x)C family spore germination protein [Alkaliphilus peptidifermentans]|uniref:Germination protein, Ger(X)C family n=1 Tax=Alkaliphilus peptidifermentans DSM 18978 TaxID=1120976 RepID=A0A1G5KB79_9FIRM|nr:Ger(x)C family spore germination protein [Alkaliphilus peptidifermentans]SCY97308.1 germination protein, Ger(x)C family [Alkaliphilus peptidifermentans DSM 18978]
MIKPFKLIAIAVIVMLLTSCWDAKQLDDLYLVYGIGIDTSQEKQQHFLVTIVAPTIDPEAPEPKVEIHSEGESLRNAQDNIQNKAARRITFANTKVLFIGEDVANKGIGIHIDSMLRDPEGRGTIKLLVVEGRAVNLMNVEPQTTALVSLYIFDLLKQSQETSTVPRVTLRSFNNDLKTDGIEPVIPFIKYGNKPSEFQINSVGLFNKDKMVGIVEGIDSMLLTLLRSEVQDGFITLPYPLGEVEESSILTLRVMRGKSKIETSLINNELTIIQEVRLNAHISEYTSSAPVFDDKTIKSMEQAANSQIKIICEELLKKLRNEFGVDSIGYGKYVKVNHPVFFDAEEWNEQFSRANIIIKPNVKIQMVGSRQ